MYLSADTLLLGCMGGLQLPHFSLKTTELGLEAVHVLPDPVLQGLLLLCLHTLAALSLQQFEFDGSGM